MVGQCKVCSQPASQVCGACKEVSYCGREHQVSDWKTGHKAECQGKLFSVQRDAVLGRHAVAMKDLPPGTQVITEKPLILGPKMNTRPVCLACHGPGPLKPCPACGWPVCTKPCGPHHSKECAVMSNAGFRCPMKASDKREGYYCVITPLRCLLLDKDDFRKLMDLESHVELRRKSKLYKVLENNLVSFIRDVLKLNFDADTIMEVAAVLDTNCFDVRCPGWVRLRGLYPRAAMLAHSCRPNTKHYFGPSQEIVLLTTVDVKKGESLTATYSQTMWGTEARREQLLASKCFHCECPRCRDPTEFGTYLGALTCPSCNRDFAVSEDPLYPASLWRCASCAHALTSNEVCNVHSALQKEVEILDKSCPEPMEMFLDKHISKTPGVHKNTYEMLQVKYALIQKYSQIPPRELSNDQQERRLGLLKELLEVAAVLEPGLSRLRGELLFQLHATKVQLLSKQQSLREDEMKEVMQIFNEAENILKTEPDLYHQIETQKEQIKLLTRAN